MSSKWAIVLAASVVGGISTVGGTLAAYQGGWLPFGWGELGKVEQEGACCGHPHDAEHDEHDESACTEGHDHGHDDGNDIEISEQAQRNIGLVVASLEPTTFTRTVTLPGMVIERPGRSGVQVAAPMAGIVTRIFPIKGETVQPHQPLFELRLNHEEVVKAQTELLKIVEELDVVRREIQRLEGITSGILPQKNVLERRYECQKLEAAQRAQVQSLILHGLTEPQVEDIIQNRRLLRAVTVRAPHNIDCEGSEDGEPRPESPGSHAVEVGPTAPALRPTPLCSLRFLEVEELQVAQGQHVQVGQSLCALSDHESLFIEGRAFDREMDLVSRARKERWPVVIDQISGKPALGGELFVAYVSNKVDQESRTFHFYVELPNDIVTDSISYECHRFIDWRFKPGQRVQLEVPVEQWANRLVLPVGAVVQEGPEAFVFVQSGERFKRVPVHVEYQDQRAAVLADDPKLKPGVRVAISGAFQLQVAMKNKAGGAVDPHAGHNH